jgi:RNA polymerase sigma factor (sigma-70 family)
VFARFELSLSYAQTQLTNATRKHNSQTQLENWHWHGRAVGNDGVYDSLRAGASGFLFKDVTPEQLVAAIRTVAAGDVMFAPSVTRRLVEQFVTRPAGSPNASDAVDTLTEREREVLTELARGLSNVEIAERLHVSQGTVKTHVSRILAKLELRDRVQAVIVAYECGLVGAKR